MSGSINWLLRQNFWLQQQKFVVPNFVAVTKQFFFRVKFKKDHSQKLMQEMPHYS